VWPHRHCPHPRVIGQGDRDRWGLAALGALQIDEVADSGQMSGILAERSSECRL